MSLSLSLSLSNSPSLPSSLSLSLSLSPPLPQGSESGIGQPLQPSTGAVRAAFDSITSQEGSPAGRLGAGEREGGGGVRVEEVGQEGGYERSHPSEELGPRAAGLEQTRQRAYSDFEGSMAAAAQATSAAAAAAAAARDGYGSMASLLDPRDPPGGVGEPREEERRKRAAAGWRHEDRQVEGRADASTSLGDGALPREGGDGGDGGGRGPGGAGVAEGVRAKIEQLRAERAMRIGGGDDRHVEGAGRDEGEQEVQKNGGAVEARKGVARFTAKRVEKGGGAGEKVGWDEVTGKDAEAPANNNNAATIAWSAVHGTSVAKQTSGVGVGEAKAGGLSQAEIEEQRRRKALAAARNPGGRAGQWVRGEKGDMEWVSHTDLQKRVEEQRQRVAAVEPARPQRVDHEQRVKAEIRAAPRRVSAMDVSSRSQLDSEDEATRQRGAVGLLAMFAAKKSAGDPEAAGKWQPPVVVGSGSRAGVAAGVPGGAGVLRREGGHVMRRVKHGPLNYDLTYDAERWEAAQEHAQDLTRQQYLLELPPGLDADPNLVRASSITVDENAVDKAYRKLFGPPASKQCGT